MNVTRRELLAGLAAGAAAAAAPADGWFPNAWTPAGWDTSRAKRVTAGANLQAALDAAKPGDILLLEAGAVWTGNFRLAPKGGDAPVTIASSAWTRLPKPGIRVSPSDGRFMPRIDSPNNMASLHVSPGSHHWRLYGLSGAHTGRAVGTGLWRLGQHTDFDTEAAMPHHIDVVQCYLFGAEDTACLRGISVNARYVTIRDSSLVNWWSYDQDAQAILGIACQYVYITNNYLEATGENVFFAEGSRVRGLWPCDVVVTRNHIYKPLSWRDKRHPTSGKPLAVKNLFELKSGRRIHVFGNVIENCWSAAQTGNLLNLKLGGNSGPNLPMTEDVIIERNLIRNGTICSAISGPLRTNPGAVVRNITLRQNAFLNIGSDWGLGGRLWVINGPVENLVIEDNTITAGGAITHAMTLGGEPSPGFVFRRNILPLGKIGVKANGTRSGAASLDLCFRGGVWTGNVFVDPTGSRDYPQGTKFVPSIDFGADGYSQQQYRAGADADKLRAATTGVVQFKRA